MLEIERLEKIIDTVTKYDKISYKKLEEIILVSSSTIRRDAKKLIKKGLVKEIKGGISKVEDFTVDIEIEKRLKENIKEKKEIALKALEIIKNGDFIYLDASSTIYYLVEKLRNRNITVVTNGIMYIENLYKNNIKTILIGGELKYTTKAIVGSEAVNSLDKYRFDISFLGTNGISLESGFSTPELNEAIVKKKVLEVSKINYILADSSKFNITSNVCFSKIEDCKIITCDKTMNQNIKYQKYFYKKEEK